MVVTWLPLWDSIVLTFMDLLPRPEVGRSLGAPVSSANADIGREFRRVTDLINFLNSSHQHPCALQIQRPIGYVTRHADDRTKLRRAQGRKFPKLLIGANLGKVNCGFPSESATKSKINSVEFAISSEAPPRTDEACCAAKT
jgi:hypothetical protein